MNLNTRSVTVPPPTAVQCPYCNTINGIGLRGGTPRPGGPLRTDLEALVDRERRRNRAEGHAFRSAQRVRGVPDDDSDSDGPLDTLTVNDMNSELLQRLQQFRRMNHAELLLVREVLEQLQGQASQPSNGATAGQIDRLTSFWKCTDVKQLASASCTICLDEYEVNQEMRTLPCFHSFHAHCVAEWLTKNKVCPVCQFDIARGAEEGSDLTLNGGQ